ncbi:MAG: EamA family transporter [Deltaproteobacteria bacterium]|nr:EamA family transporter [Deltaproteobacteria bacterium]
MSTDEKSSRADPDLNRGRLFVLLTGILWSLAGVFIKSLDLHPLTIVFYRSLFASLFFFLFVRTKSWTVSGPLLVSVVSYTAAISFFVWANKLTTAANAIVLQYTAPIFVFLFVRLLFREPISRPNLMTLLFGMVGVAVIFVGSAGQPDSVGVMMALLSGFLFSVYMTNLRFLKNINPGYLTLVNNLVCWLTLFPLVQSQLSLSPGQAFALAIMGVVQLGIPYFLFSKGLETVSLQEASLIVLIEPVLNPIWVAFVVGEIPSPATLVGGGIILLSLTCRYVGLLSTVGRVKP